jgi:methionyl-tRNA formyltransferase
MEIKNHIGIFADGLVGNKVLIFLLENYFSDVLWVVCNNEQSQAWSTLNDYNFDSKKVFLNSQLKEASVLEKLISSNVDFILLAWWPFIIKEPILSLPNIGVLNFHPSMLPFNRGKNYNFWTIVENTPYGVSIHFVNETIDGGDIIFQKQIGKDWSDTGETLYFKAQDAIVELFTEKYPDIRKGNYVRNKQDPELATFHYEKELDQASEIILSKKYEARDLINLIRARTFLPHPAAWFEEDGAKYEVRINITKI